MLGAIIGDIVGSRFEWNNYRSKDFIFFHEKSHMTDDSIMAVAIAKAILSSKPDRSDLGEKAIYYMRYFGYKYPNYDYGGMLSDWLTTVNPKPYNSFGNGAAMRVSACAFAATSLEEAQILSKLVTEVTHNHPEGLKGAEATTVAIYLARTGYTIPQIREYINNNYYPLDFTLDDIRNTYQFNETCQDSCSSSNRSFFLNPRALRMSFEMLYL